MCGRRQGTGQGTYNKSHRPGGSEPCDPCSKSPTLKCLRTALPPGAWGLQACLGPSPCLHPSVVAFSVSLCPNIPRLTGTPAAGWGRLYPLDLILTNDTGKDPLFQISPIPRLGGTFLHPHSIGGEAGRVCDSLEGGDRTGTVGLLSGSSPHPRLGPVVPAAR